MSQFDYDVAVIGSGFGGSVTAMRLTEKGYRVAVLEAGRRFADDELPRTSWDIRRYLWAPWARCFGIMRITLLRDVLIASGAGVGGGSLVYANTLYEPGEPFYRDPQWAGITDWRAELAPHYAQARRMLGVTTYPGWTTPDRLLAEIADELGAGDTVHPADVGVLFGERPGEEVPDPFFGGVGPQRRTCTECGSCMTGCRVGAKNTLVKNYLHLAEQGGADVHALTTVTDVRPLAGGGYRVRTRHSGRPWQRRTLRVEQVVFAGNALNTQTLLHRLRRRSLPRLSSRIGVLSRTNSEAVLTARAGDRAADHTAGLAITSSFHPDEHTHVEPVRYGPGSGLIGLLNAHLVDPVDGVRRWRATLRQYRTLGLRAALRVHRPGRWAEQSIVLLTMQSLDNSITTFLRRRPWGLRLTSRQGTGEPNPEWIPVAHQVARRLAEKVDGVAGGSVADLVGIPMTAHFIGGCAIGSDPECGVIDPYQRVFGYEGLHIADGSAISANLGVNPSLTIAAQAERAMSFWPVKGERDPRPPLGAGYVRLDPVAPRTPLVPEHAPAVLHWA
ncbi:GMC family oxidoreductase [Aeromicrobium phragmitis]|uniref:Cholesterol oxidase n=1 Tax=Aeromicrobium phragmitis TaxID=2478914 RepID=A0A3L8PLN2_9ACTN|nr:GMC family oxidoreductase [Aeromicrobium phragmitis]RLV56170.1 GMC family oxidoreductase [Aeromicrobium phragmitis]